MVQTVYNNIFVNSKYSNMLTLGPVSGSSPRCCAPVSGPHFYLYSFTSLLLATNLPTDGAFGNRLGNLELSGYSCFQWTF